MAAAAEKEPKNPRQKYREDIDADLVTYLRSLQANTPIKVSVIRKFPVTWEGQSIKGTLDTFEEPISEEDLRDMYGGGKYQLMIRVPDESGGWVFATSRTLEIAGNPKLVSETGSANSNGSNGGNGHRSDDAVQAALRMSAGLVDKAQEMADRERDRYQPQTNGLEFVMREMAAMREQQAEKDREIFRVMTERKDSAAEMLLGKAIDGESARMQQLRAQIDSELRMKNEMHRAEVERIHTAYTDLARRQDDQYKREIDNLNRAYESRSEATKLAHDSVVAGYQREISHLDRELTAAKTELAELRARKDKGLTESITELSLLKEAMESLTGGGDKEESQSTVERILSSIMGSPLAEGVAARLAGPASAAVPQLPAAPPEPDLPVNRPLQLPDGRVVVRRQDGSVVQLRSKKTAAPEPPPPSDISDDDLRNAMQFMESALHNDSDPAEFARTASLLVPQLANGPLKETLRTQGVDAFLGRMAKLSPQSPLLSQHGKNWVRKVSAALIG